jgi:hypothetical protein
MITIGQTGQGKSTLLRNMLLSDIAAGRGVALLDPHGDLADSLLDAIPPSRTRPLISTPWTLPIRFENVPAQVCTKCGEIWVDEKTLQAIDRLIAQGRPMHHVPTPLYDFALTSAK